MSAEHSFDNKKFLRKELSRVAEILEKVDLVGLDADQILIRSEVSVLQEFNSLFKTSFRPEDSDWGSVIEWLTARGFSRPDAEVYDEYIWTDPDILFNSPPVPGGREAYRVLETMGKEIHIITSRIPSLEKITRLWFSQWMFWVSQERIHINSNPSLVGREFKAKKISELGLGVFFEDSPEHARKILDNTDAFVVLVSSKKGSANFEYQGPNERLVRIPSMLVLHEYLTGNPI